MTDAKPPRTPPEEKYAQAPFHATSSGDCLIRCSDKVLFKPSRAVLSLASPVLRDKLKLPEGGNGSSFNDNLEPISIDLPSTLFHTILLLLYPSTASTVISYAVAFKLLKAYADYQINVDPLRPIVKDFFSKAQFAPDYEAHYALAWTLGLRGEAEKASRHLHRHDIHNSKFQARLIETAGDPLALTALLELRLRQESSMQAFLEELPLELYHCEDHPPSVVDLGKLRDVVKSELRDPVPSAIGLLKSLLQVAFNNREQSVPPGGPFGVVPVFANANAVARPAPKLKIVESSGSHCAYHGCSEKPEAKTPSEFYDAVRRVELAIEKFPQDIKWPESKGLFFF